MKHFYLIANPSKPGALGMAENLRQNFYGEGQPACIRGDIPDRIRFRQIQSVSSRLEETEP